MRSDIPQPILDEYTSGHSYPALLAELFFDSGTLRMWTGIGTLTWNDEEFIGGGNFIGISPITEKQDIVAEGVVVSLNGIPVSNVSAILNEKVRGRKFNLYLSAIISTHQAIDTEDEPGSVMTEDGGYVLTDHQITEDPYKIFSGLMDVIEFTDNGSEATIRLSVENVLIKGQRSKVSRYTPEDQKRKYPNDKGLDFINQLQDKEVVW